MTTGLLNPVHIALLLVVALMLFGAKRLPEMGKSLGTGLRGFKQSLDGITEDERPQLVATNQVEMSAAPTTARLPSQPLESISERPGPDTAA